MHKDLEKLFEYDWNETTKTFSRMPWKKVAIHKEFIKIDYEKYSKNIFEEFLLLDLENKFFAPTNDKVALEKTFKKYLEKIIHG